jgi:leucine-rich PPR motif-containing protein, mitochondrial
MQNSGVHKAALMTALEMALSNGSTATAFALMGKVKDMGKPLRQHYFWPLLVAESKKKNNQEGFCQVLIEMQKLGVNPRGETIRDYILDHLKGGHMDKLQFLRSCGVSQGSASLTVALGLLDNLQLEEAADLGKSTVLLIPH